MNVLSIGANRLLIVALNVGKEIDRQCLSDQRICYNRYTNTWLTISGVSTFSGWGGILVDDGKGTFVSSTLAIPAPLIPKPSAEAAANFRNKRFRESC